ncbi:transglutaminase family protein [Methanolobus sediminis]|uniref:Transglutaminase family protein n=1 Tax=Methanolobus sediminis TaxID=3072978 RepID=A0AA51YL10_9EURY|nr:transglutaminase family protein [Methanolobus sediminis]WMW24494.1 transglutaminase family protein [Methanolobus sediminis]
MKNEKKTKMLKMTFMVLLLSGIILSSGCISESVKKVEDIFDPSSVTLFQSDDYYTLDSSELTIPVVPSQSLNINDGSPDRYTEKMPGFEISSSYYYTEFFEGTEAVISVYVHNMGDSPVYIYHFGFKLNGENEMVSHEAGINVEPGEEIRVGILFIEVPEDSTQIRLDPVISLLVQTDSGKWHDYGEQDFENISIEVSDKMDAQNPKYSTNPEQLFTLVNEKIDPYDVQVRTMAAASAKKYPGQYNIYQLCYLFDDTKENIQYVSDPRGKDLWSTPGETITVGAGDCDDYAILLASLIEAIGGTSRVYLTDTHAFTAAYIGNDTEIIADAIGEYYGPVPIYYTTDEYGCWLMMDPTSSIYAGGLPGGTAPTENGWTFLNTSTVTVIDIAPQT